MKCDPILFERKYRCRRRRRLLPREAESRESYRAMHRLHDSPASRRAAPGGIISGTEEVISKSIEAFPRTAEHLFNDNSSSLSFVESCRASHSKSRQSDSEHFSGRQERMRPNSMAGRPLARREFPSAAPVEPRAVPRACPSPKAISYRTAS